MSLKDDVVRFLATHPGLYYCRMCLSLHLRVSHNELRSVMPTIGFAAPDIVTTQGPCVECGNPRTIFAYKPRPRSVGAMALKAEPGPLAGVFVLVIDDEEDSRVVMETTLQYAGALVTAVPSARAAYEVLRYVTCDVMVVDLRMSDDDGLSFAQAVKRVPVLKTIPLLAVTAYAELYERHVLREAGFVDVLRKPFVFSELVQAIGRLVSAKPDR